MSTYKSIINNFEEEKNDLLDLKLEKFSNDPYLLILHLNGDLVEENAHSFRLNVIHIMESGFTRLVFDCSNLKTITSSGIGTITSLLKLINDRNGDIVLINISKSFLYLIKLLGLNKFFHIYSNLVEAIDYFHPEYAFSENKLFPLIFRCPICSKKQKSKMPGQFRCSECDTILIIDSNGEVSTN